MSIVVLVTVAVVALAGVCRKILKAKQKTRNEWLEGLLRPSVSLEKLMFSLHQAFPSGFNDWHQLFDHHGCIKMRTFRALFSERLMWQLVDVFVRNAEQHFKVLSPCQSGQALILRLSDEIFSLYGLNARMKIENAPLSEEAKQKFLT
jgi:hypothetical protein